MDKYQSKALAVVADERRTMLSSVEVVWYCEEANDDRNMA